MSASSFSKIELDELLLEFSLRVKDDRDMFAKVASAKISDHLKITLTENLPLSRSINTEKAYSELIIMPILVELRRITNHRISLFSGIELNVDPARKLKGICDFILSQSPEQVVLKAPVFMLVEAKKGDINAAFGQCAGEMLAAQMFNERRGQKIKKIYGAVTSGTLWKFLRLEKDLLEIDATDYHISDVEKILGILLHTVGEESQLVRQ